MSTTGEWRRGIMAAGFAAGWWVGGGHVQAQQVPAASFVKGACGFKAGKGFQPGKNLTCGFLIVPENRAITGGRTIKLAVAIFRSPSSQRQPDPVVFLQGGPGGRIIKDLAPAITSGTASFFLGNRDLILIDRRGTGMSKTALNCPKADKALEKAVSEGQGVPQQSAAEAAGLAACRIRLTARGIDLSAYNTDEDAADIANLRTALGLSEMNVYGVSYGTRVALQLMRLHPAGIRSVVLDSIVSPQYNLLVDPISAEAQSFNRVFATCRAIASCNTRFPHLKRTFQYVLQLLNKHPQVLYARVGNSSVKQKVVLNAMQFANMLHSLLYISPLIYTMPPLIYLASHGQLKTVGRIYEQSRIAANEVATGTYESVLCGEDLPGFSSAALQKAIDKIYAPVRTQMLQQQESMVNLCRVWNVAQSSPTVHQPIVSSIPTLLMEGELDPITRPNNIDAVSPGLSHSFDFVYPGLGHGVLYSARCPTTMYFAFLNHPDARPDNSCISGMKEPFRYR